MTDEKACATPLLELARSVPKDLRAEWPIQFSEDGRPSGHAMAPVGRYLHDLADENERLKAELKAEVNARKAMEEHGERWVERIEQLERVCRAALKDQHGWPNDMREAIAAADGTTADDSIDYSPHRQQSTTEGE